MRRGLPAASDATRALAGGLIASTLGAVGKQFRRPRCDEEIDIYADAMADMLVAYLERLPCVIPA